MFSRSRITVFVSLGALSALALGLAAFHVAKAGYFYIAESAPLLTHYLSDNSVVWKVFYTPGTEGPGYVFRARELSFFFNWLDAEFIRISFGIGAPHFISLTHLLASFSLVVMHLYYSNLCAGEDQEIFLPMALVSALIFTSPTVIYSAQYFRTGKILSGFFLAWQVWLLFTAYIAKSSGKNIGSGAAWLYFLVSLLAGMSDEQGLFLTFSLASIIPYIYLVHPERLPRSYGIAALAALLLLGLYRLWIGQALTQAIAGLAVSRFNPQFPSHAFTEYLFVWKESWLILFSYLSNLFGAGNKYVVMILLVLLGRILFKAEGEPKNGGSFFERILKSPVLPAAYILLMVSVMLFLMTVTDSADPRFNFRSPYAAVTFLKMWYYPLPVICLFSALMATLIYYLLRTGFNRKVISWICLALVLGNIYSVIARRKVMKTHAIAQPGIAQHIVYMVLTGINESPQESDSERLMKTLAKRLRQSVPH